MYNINLDNVDIQLNTFKKEFSKYANPTIPFYNFVNKTYPKLCPKDYVPGYEKEVWIPKPVKELVNANKDDPATYAIGKLKRGYYSMSTAYDSDKQCPIWFNDSTDGVRLLLGYQNGDSRFPCDLVMGDSNIHMIMAGATGQGKSVTLNNLIFNIACLYAPWDVRLVLCDAKIVEFKTYAYSSRLPHITSIAATEDADYMISVLETMVDEMNMWNSIFPKFGEKKIGDVRSAFNLAIPQTIIVIDEFQTMFINAGKKAGRLTELLNLFARLGRSTGFHLILASQEIGNAIPPDILSNIGVRVAMGCTEAVSNKILGNDEAKTIYNIKGQLIVNNNPAESKIEDNKKYKVPFLSPKDQTKCSKELISRSETAKFQQVLSFYDQQAIIYVDKYGEYLKTFTHDPNAIMLGEPAFVIDSPEKILKLNLTGENNENIIVDTPNKMNVKRHFLMLKENAKLHKDWTNIVWCLDPVYEANDLNAKSLVKDNAYYDTSRAYQKNKTIQLIKGTIKKRRILLKCDKLLFKDGVKGDRSITDPLFSEVVSNKQYDTELMRERFAIIHKILSEDVEFRTLFDLQGDAELSPEYFKGMVNSFIKTYKINNALDRQLVIEDFNKVFVWILGFERIKGISENPASKLKEEFELILKNCSEANVRFITFMTTVGDSTFLKTSAGWYIFDNTPMTEINKLGAGDYFPATVTPGLAVLFSRLAEKDKCSKFKKIYFEGELV